MKILVYGAGALGSLMVHYLCKAGNDVTVCARSTYDELSKNGVIVRHYLQRKTTVDLPRIVRAADESDRFDIVISVMQGQQQKTLLDTLAKLNTRLVVLVGNNLEADYCEKYIHEHSASRRLVLFGFQNSAGHREGAKAVVGRLPVTELVVGGLHSAANPKAIKMLRKAFNTDGYKITPTDDMYAYYMYHIAEIMPYVYLCYTIDCDLKRADRSDIKNVIKASYECFEYLKSEGIKVTPNGEDSFYSGGVKTAAMYLVYRLMSRTVLGELMVSDHCKNGSAELLYLDSKFEEYRKSHGYVKMPVWDKMRRKAVLSKSRDSLSSVAKAMDKK